MKNLISFLLLLSIGSIMAQSDNQNWVKSIAYKVATQNAISNPTINQATTQVSYFDGLGRPIQVVNHAQANDGNDIIQHIEYDVLGRQTKEFLPFVSNTASLDYNAITANDVINYYDTAAYQNTTNPYSEKQIENSPLNRILKQAAPGNDWQLGNGHEIKFDYQANSTGEVRMFEVNTTYHIPTKTYNPVLVSSTSTYNENQLYKNITVDENNTTTSGNQTEEFTNKLGKVVLKRIKTNGGTETFDTYYIYDDFGNLTFVLPPLVDTTQATITPTVLNGLCYQYKYDYRNRLVAKKIPSKQWEYIVYDKLDRVRATGPTVSPFNNDTRQGWLITKYDNFNRPILTAWQAGTVSATTRFALENSINNATALSDNKATSPTTILGVTYQYSNDSYPQSNYHILTLSYFDTYNYPNAPTNFNTVFGQEVRNGQNGNCKGFTTGNWVRILTTSSAVNGNLSYTLYKNDRLSSPVQSTINYLHGGFTSTKSEIDFEGKVLRIETSHLKAANGLVVNTKENFSYTPQGRLVANTHQIGYNNVETLTANTYNKLGVLVKKHVGKTAINPLQKVDYKYNIRGWLTDINNINTLSDNVNDLFAFKIKYNTPNNGIALHNGNISETYWKTNSDNMLRKYTYNYDGLNRLTNAIYKNTATGVNNTYNEQLTYDKNGNILSLSRTGGFESLTQTTLIDDLDYFYDPNHPNQLKKVVDLTNSPQGFKDDSNGSLSTDLSDDYAYDQNGNMTKDENKNITNIKYNHLNLPVEIQFTGVRKIQYTYDATGVKQVKTVINGTNITSTYYKNGYQYEEKTNAQISSSPKLLFFPTSEGYVKAVYDHFDNSAAPKYQYVYNYTDHLGNIRMSYTANRSGIAGVAKKMEETHYYPFGLKHGNYNQAVMALTIKESFLNASIKEVKREPAVANSYKYKYNGKEWQEEFGLNLYDYGARNYDAAIGRWMNIDPLAEKMRRHSPYNYAFDNPIFFIDPNGMAPEDNIVYIIYTGKNKKEKENTIKMINQANVILKGYGLETRLVAFSNKKKFDRSVMDNNDGLILIGEEESVKAYDRDNNLSGNWIQKEKGEAGWKTNQQGYNPESSKGGESRIGYITSNEKGDRLTLFTLHSMGHQTKDNSPYDDHVGGKENHPNIMSLGVDLSSYMRQNGSKGAKEIMSRKRFGNKHWKRRITENFGTNIAMDNYDKNDKSRIGPRRADGSF